jgi:hypothetical protein
MARAVRECIIRTKEKSRSSEAILKHSDYEISSNACKDSGNQDKKSARKFLRLESQL